MSNSQIEQARGLLKAKRYDEARALLKTMPDDPTAQKWLAKLDELYPEPPPAPEPGALAETPSPSVILDAARQLILEKRYAEARMLLKTVDDPVAWTWLAKLDQIAPEPKSAKVTAAKHARSTFGIVALSVIAVLLLVVVWLLFVRPTLEPTTAAILPSNTMPIPTVMVLPTETQTPRPTSGPSEMELTATAVISANASVEAQLYATQTHFVDLNAESLTAEAKQSTASVPSATVSPIRGSWMDLGDGSVYQEIGHWVVTQTIDEFTDETSYLVFGDSEDTFRGWLDEYHATLAVGCYNNNLRVAVDIDTQFDVEYGAGDYITVLLRFDNEAASSAIMRELESGSVAIFENPEEMLRQLLSHNSLLFGFTPFNAAQASVTFDLTRLQEALDASEHTCETQSLSSITLPTATVAPPKVEFTVSPSSGDSPLIVYFGNESQGQITSYLWEFGDGTTEAQSNPVHTFAMPGVYDVTLTVGGPGGVSSITHQVNIR